MPRHYGPGEPNPELPVSSRYFDIGLPDAQYLSGAQLLDENDHARELFLVLRVLRRGESGLYQKTRITRVW
jgi:hypothetical protein